MLRLVAVVLVGCTTSRLTSLVTLQPDCPAASRQEKVTGAGVAWGALAVGGTVGLLYLAYLAELGSALAGTH
jgi:hypothetical protein